MVLTERDGANLESERAPTRSTAPPRCALAAYGLDHALAQFGEEAMEQGMGADEWPVRKERAHERFDDFIDAVRSDLKLSVAAATSGLLMGGEDGPISRRMTNPPSSVGHAQDEHGGFVSTLFLAALSTSRGKRGPAA